MSKLMNSTIYHLAQLNVSRIVAPLTDPVMADFVAQLDTINAIADRTPGFVWRLQTEAGNATDIQAFDDPHLLVNLSVWESVEALQTFVYRGGHGQAMRDRRRWFEKSDLPSVVLWWVAAGQIPTLPEAQARLNHLRQYGATPKAFTFAKPFAPLAAETPYNPYAHSPG